MLAASLPDTQLTRRLEKEGRLHKDHDIMLEERAGDQCSIGINFEPVRPLRDILTDYKRVVDTVYAPENFARRLEKLATVLDRRDRRNTPVAGDRRGETSSAEMIHGIINAVPGTREIFWNTFKTIAPDQSECAAPHRDPDVALHAPRSVLAARDRYHRPAYRRARCGRAARHARGRAVRRRGMIARSTAVLTGHL